MEYAAPQEVGRLQRVTLIVGITALVLTVVGAFVSPDQFFRSYLLAFVFWIGIPLGCYAIVMIHHLAGGSWGMVIRRLLESAIRTMPLIALMFVPLLFGLQRLYVWAIPERVSGDAILMHKSAYLNVSFFLVRAAIYFSIWLLIAFLLNKWSREEDETGDPRVTRKLQVLSAPGLLLLGGTVTFASVDWVMSLEPHWYSTIFGLLVLVGQSLSAVAFIIAVVVILAQYKPMSEVVTPRHLNDLGKLMLAFVMIWAYLSFSQFLIIWSGNLPEETPWYLSRLSGGWQLVAGALIVLHFFLPFLLLLPRSTNRNPRILVWIAVLVIVMRYVDMFWLIGPSEHGVGHEAHLRFHWLDAAAPVGLGGIWLATFFWQLTKLPLLPINAPELEEGLEHGRE